MSERIKRVLIILFIAWAVCFQFVILAAALDKESITDLLTWIGIAVYAVLFNAFWRRRDVTTRRLNERFTNRFRGFVVSGWLTAMFLEFLLFTSLSYTLGISLFLDFLYTTPLYLGLFVIWYRLALRYDFSYREAFFLGGLNGLAIETPNKLISGTGLLEMILGAPIHIFLYGTLILTPLILFRPQTTSSNKSSKTSKYLAGAVGVPVLLIPFGLLAVLILSVGRNIGM